MIRAMAAFVAVGLVATLVGCGGDADSQASNSDATNSSASNDYGDLTQVKLSVPNMV